MTRLPWIRLGWRNSRALPRSLAGDPTYEADGVLNAQLDGSELSQIQSACTSVGAVVELLEQSDDILQVGVYERGKGIVEWTYSTEAELDPENVVWATPAVSLLRWGQPQTRRDRVQPASTSCPASRVRSCRSASPHRGCWGSGRTRRLSSVGRDPDRSVRVRRQLSWFATPRSRDPKAPYAGPR